MRTETQPHPETGKWREVPTLPAELVLSPTQVAEIEAHAADLERLCGPTPEDDADAEAEMLTIITKMMLVLPASGVAEIGTIARGEAFAIALEDLPTWSIKAALRRWYRNDAGKDARGKPYDCHWQPSPGDLRAVAMLELWHLKARIQQLRRLTMAEPLIEYSGEHCADMRKRLHEMWNDIAANGGHGLRPDLSPEGEKSRAA